MADIENTLKSHQDKLDDLASRMTNLESRLFDFRGDKGFFAQTDAQFNSLKKEIGEGFGSVNEVLKEQNKALLAQFDDHKDILDSHESRILFIEKRNKQIDKEKADKKAENRKFFKTSVAQAAPGWFAAIFIAAKTLIIHMGGGN